MVKTKTVIELPCAIPPPESAHITKCFTRSWQRMSLTYTFPCRLHEQRAALYLLSHLSRSVSWKDCMRPKTSISHQNETHSYIIPSRYCTLFFLYKNLCNCYCSTLRHGVQHTDLTTTYHPSNSEMNLRHNPSCSCSWRKFQTNFIDKKFCSS